MTENIFNFIINLGYLLGAIAFVWGLRLLSSPDTAKKGNMLAGIGMGLAILAALFTHEVSGPNNYMWIIGGGIVGSIVGYVSAKKVKMTDMPQMVSIFNGLGGACAILLAVVELFLAYDKGMFDSSSKLVILLSTILIGGITFTGSVLAYAKLQGLVKGNMFMLPKHNMINNIMLIALIALGGYLFMLGAGASTSLALVFLFGSLIFGASFVIPIGGADMPVVISLLNSFSGISAAAAGLIYDNNIMLVGGILVGASGTILTVLMTKAMNRSLMNVLIGGFGETASGGGAKGASGDEVAKEVSINDAAIQLYYSDSVMIIPGYGLAVAQAQKACKEVDDLLTANGVQVTYGIHPVAGRMPGHMNVLLAEADVPYEKLLDLDDANSALPSTDVVVIVGANDVVNPSAIDEPGSPIYGMPVLEVWKAKNTIVLKRSMSPGYAGIQNPLFFKNNNHMLFGDAKASLTKMVSELKEM